MHIEDKPNLLSASLLYLMGGTVIIPEDVIITMDRNYRIVQWYDPMTKTYTVRLERMDSNGVYKGYKLPSTSEIPARGEPRSALARQSQSLRSWLSRRLSRKANTEDKENTSGNSGLRSTGRGVHGAADVVGTRRGKKANSRGGI